MLSPKSRVLLSKNSRGRKTNLTTAMKSVGEVMSVGRTIHESLQKALASMETGLNGFNEIDIDGMPAEADIIRADDPSGNLPYMLVGADPAAQEAIDKNLTRAMSEQTPDRILIIAHSMRFGFSDEEIFEITKFDPWFLARIREIIAIEQDLRVSGLPTDAAPMRRLKMYGFTDARLAELTGTKERNIRIARTKMGVVAVFKRIDTCAAEFEAPNPLYVFYV